MATPSEELVLASCSDDFWPLRGSSSGSEDVDLDSVEDAFFHAVGHKHFAGIEKKRVQRRPWTNAEDAIVRRMVALEGTRAWSTVAEQLKGRTGKQCRERWHNHLDDSVKKEPWSLAEERMLLELQRHFGNRWSDIAKYLTGRTDNAIKNHWNSVLRKGTNISHLLLPGGRLPSSFPRGVVPPPSAAPPEAEAADEAERPRLCVPTALEADKINRLLRADPESTLAKLVEYPVSAVCHEQRSTRAQTCLSALLATLRATARQELLDATARLQDVIRDALELDERKGGGAQQREAHPTNAIALEEELAESPEELPLEELPLLDSPLGGASEPQCLWSG